MEDCAKDSREEFLPRCIALELQIFTDSIGTLLKNALHLSKNSLPPSSAQSSIRPSFRSQLRKLFTNLSIELNHLPTYLLS